MTQAASTQKLDPRLCQSVFIAGTDTGVGKTWVAVRLLRALAFAGYRAAGFKPVAAGANHRTEGWRNDDAQQLLVNSGTGSLRYEDVNPYCLIRPTSPHLAAAEEGIEINIDTILAKYRELRPIVDTIVVEGAGGWLTPIGRTQTMQDVAQALALPVVLVVGLRLGALNHAMLTAAAIRAAGLPLAGWIANPIDADFADRDHYVTALQERLDAPLLRITDINFKHRH